MSKEKVVKEKIVKEETGNCGSCKWWDTTTTREFHRDGIRPSLVEIRSICRSPSSKAKGHLTAKPSVRPCFERGTFVPEKKEEKAKVKEPKKKKTVAPKKGSCDLKSLFLRVPENTKSQFHILCTLSVLLLGFIRLLTPIFYGFFAVVYGCELGGIDVMNVEGRGRSQKRCGIGG